MSRAFDEIKAALEEAIAHTRGEPTGVKVREVPRVDVAALRARLGMSQAEFADVFGFARGTLRGWEQNRREPEGPAKVLLRVIEREPEAVLRALHVPMAALE
jgi:putative transcriptional regulator